MRIHEMYESVDGTPLKVTDNKTQGITPTRSTRQQNIQQQCTQHKYSLSFPAWKTKLRQASEVYCKKNAVFYLLLQACINSLVFFFFFCAPSFPLCSNKQQFFVPNRELVDFRISIIYPMVLILQEPCCSQSSTSVLQIKLGNTMVISLEDDDVTKSHSVV